jgi:hypothetical protein
LMCIFVHRKKGTDGNVRYLPFLYIPFLCAYRNKYALMI